MVIDLTHSDDQSEKPLSLKGSEPSRKRKASEDAQQIKRKASSGYPSPSTHIQQSQSASASASTSPSTTGPTLSPDLVSAVAFSSEALPTSTLAIISASISSLLSESARSSASALVSGPSLASNSALPISGSTPSSILTSVQENTQENAHTPSDSVDGTTEQTEEKSDDGTQATRAMSQTKMRRAKVAKATDIPDLSSYKQHFSRWRKWCERKRYIDGDKVTRDKIVLYARESTARGTIHDKDKPHLSVEPFFVFVGTVRGIKQASNNTMMCSLSTVRCLYRVQCLENGISPNVEEETGLQETQAILRDYDNLLKEGAFPQEDDPQEDDGPLEEDNPMEEDNPLEEDNPQEDDNNPELCDDYERQYTTGIAVTKDFGDCLAVMNGTRYFFRRRTWRSVL
ncbi:hypothetical protein BGX33_011091 [Mortierella sp. NVP41]|nr:hypothetical protein BGX33_011091 [Mortierella sp. NVP41]